MEWLNLHTSVLDSPEFLGSDPIDRATWLCLLRYCAGQESGGIINDCFGWTDRKWQQLCRVTLDEVERECDLWSWDGNNLLVHYYPVKSENHVKSARVNGRLGGRPPKKKPPGLTQKKPPGITQQEPHGETQLEPRQNPLQREGKEKEGKGSNPPIVPPKGGVEKKTRKRFKPPTLEEVKAYVKAKGYSFSPETFHAHYEANGWMIGKAKMKKWESACVTWEKNMVYRRPTQAARSKENYNVAYD